MGTLTDEDLASLLGEAAASFDVPEDGPDEVRAELADEAEVVPLRRRRWVQVPAAAAVVTAALLAGSVWGGPGGDGVPQIANLSGESAGESYGLDQSARGGATGGSSGEVADGSGDKLTRRSAGGSQWTGTTWTGAAPAPAAGGQAAPPVPAAPTADGARVVKTGAIALVVDDGRVTPVLTQVQQLAQEFGGEVSVAKTEELGETPSGSVTLRVPVDQFEEVVAKVRSLDAEVRSATTSGRDVTAEYADLETQIRTLTAARERFLEILSRARTIGDVLAVQQRVDDATGKIDRLEGQRRVLAAQSERATLEVVVTEDDDPIVARAKPDDGIGKAFSDAWDGFTSGIEGLIRHSGRALVVLLVATAAWVVLRLGWRASRRRLV